MHEGNRLRALTRSFLIKVISECYAAPVRSLHRLKSDSGKSIYRVDLANGASWILRIVDQSQKERLGALAQLLLLFEQSPYPAERIIPTTEHAALATVGDWHLVMTTCLSGAALDISPPTLFLLGASVGQLHALTPVLTFSPPPSPMLPTGEIAFAQHRLATVASLVPRQFLEQYAWLEQALAGLDPCTALPATLIHNDCHPANALVTAPGQVTLLDWEEAGSGPAILDFGCLLMNCDGKAPWDPLPSPPYQLDEGNLQAVIEGYCQYAHVTLEDLDHLCDAMRFRSLVFGADRFATAIAKQEPAEFAQWWWARYEMAEEITEQARALFTRLLP